MPTFKGVDMPRYTPSTIAKMSAAAKARDRSNQPRGATHGKWKGDAAGYRAKHTWIAKLFGRPTLCEKCGLSDKNPRRYHWANLSGKYKRDRSDWKRLCVSCHIRFDGSAKKGRPTYSFNGENLRLAEWAQKLGMSKCTLARRVLFYKWSLKRALETPLRKYGVSNQN